MIWAVINLDTQRRLWYAGPDVHRWVLWCSHFSFLRAPKSTSTVAAIDIPTKRSSPPHPHQQLLVFVFLVTATLIRVGWDLRGVWIFISLELKGSSTYSSTDCLSFFGESCLHFISPVPFYRSKSIRAKIGTSSGWNASLFAFLSNPCYKEFPTYTAMDRRSNRCHGKLVSYHSYQPQTSLCSQVHRVVSFLYMMVDPEPHTIHKWLGPHVKDQDYS